MIDKKDLEIGKFIIIREGQEVWADCNDIKPLKGLPMKIIDIRYEREYIGIFTKYGEWVQDEIEVVFEEYQVEYWL